jgi:hypothetical protein
MAHTIICRDRLRTSRWKAQKYEHRFHVVTAIQQDAAECFMQLALFDTTRDVLKQDGSVRDALRMLADKGAMSEEAKMSAEGALMALDPKAEVHLRDVDDLHVMMSCQSTLLPPYHPHHNSPTLRPPPAHWCLAVAPTYLAAWLPGWLPGWLTDSLICVTMCVMSSSRPVGCSADGVAYRCGAAVKRISGVVRL